MPLKPKPLSKKVTARFLQEMDRIVTPKLTAKIFAANVGTTVSNINRLRGKGNDCVTLETCCLLFKHYGTDPVWLMTGKAEKPALLTRIERLETAVFKANV